MKEVNKCIMDCLNEIRKLKRDMPERTEANAESVAEKLIKSLHINEYPVPIVQILNDLGFSVFITSIPDSNISGFISIHPDNRYKFGTDKIIAVEKSDPPERQRFTMANEFSHYLFDFDEEKTLSYFNTYDSSKSSDPEERIHKRFAATFLMPKKMFMDRYNELNKQTNYERLNILVDDFYVNSKSVKKRFSEVGIKSEADFINGK